MFSKKVKKVLPAMNFVGNIMVRRESQNLFIGSSRHVVSMYGDSKIISSVIEHNVLFIDIS